MSTHKNPKEPSKWSDVFDSDDEKVIPDNPHSFDDVKKTMFVTQWEGLLGMAGELDLSSLVLETPSFFKTYEKILCDKIEYAVKDACGHPDTQEVLIKLRKIQQDIEYLNPGGLFKKLDVWKKKVDHEMSLRIKLFNEFLRTLKSGGLSEIPPTALDGRKKPRGDWATHVDINNPGGNITHTSTPVKKKPGRMFGAYEGVTLPTTNNPKENTPDGILTILNTGERPLLFKNYQGVRFTGGPCKIVTQQKGVIDPKDYRKHCTFTYDGKNCKRRNCMFYHDPAIYPEEYASPVRNIEMSYIKRMIMTISEGGVEGLKDPDMFTVRDVMALSQLFELWGLKILKHVH